MVNCIIGSGIFGLPSVIASLVGNASPLAWLFAAAGTGLVMACFAEVSSRFDQTGGIYLYTRTAFGQTAGITIAWLGWLTRLTAAAANVNIFIIYLAEFWPAAKAPVPRFLVMTVLLAFLTVVNYVGVRSGTRLSNVFTAAKLLTLAGFIGVGFLFLALRHHPLMISPPAGPVENWRHSILLLMFAYGGYEAGLMPAGEARNPRRDYPFALFVALAACTFIYTATQWLVVSVLPQSSPSDRPLAAAAQIMLGPWGATLISIGVLISSYGLLGANILGFPRILFALAEHGDLPAAMAKVHPKFRTPHVAIVVFAVCLWGFSLAGSFQWNITMSAGVRLIYYASVCVALLVLRRRENAPRAEFHLPLGPVFAMLAVGASLWLFPKFDKPGTWVLAVLALIVVVNSLWAQHSTQKSETQQQPVAPK
jgi:basic amino acid/polyamine antiporter, APA family